MHEIYGNRTPLHLAAALDNYDISLYLIEKGSDINIPNGNFYTPLMFAGIRVAILLVEKGADVNYISPYGWSALAEAFGSGKVEVADYLINNGVNIQDAKTHEGMKMLIAALRAGSINYLDKCLQAGLNPAIESESGSNLIHFAAESNSLELINKLINLGVQPDKTNIYGWTPLHTAAYHGSKKVVELLIQHGLSKDERTPAGKTPFILASESKVLDLVNYLDSIGADRSPQSFPVLKGDYLSGAKPGNTAVPFAPEIVSAQANYHSSIAFTPDGNELYGKSMQPFMMIGSKRVNGIWTMPDTVEQMMYGDVPIISPDGNKFYILVMQQVPGQPVKEAIFVMDKTSEGWTEPSPLPEIVNSVPGIHWQASIDRNGNLYFGARQNGTVASRIYYSEYKDGLYTEPILFESLKDVDAHSPFISPHGSYLIISSNGLKILFRKKDGSWTKEISLTEVIGYEGFCPIVTHDGKYLFFVHDVGDRNIPYWVSARFIEDLRPKE